MSKSVFADLARAGESWLYECDYFGRLIQMGITPNGKNVQMVSAISGRSPGSQNRIYAKGVNNSIHTEVADKQREVGDPELTLYSAHAENTDVRLRLYGVSNGKQTVDLVASHNSLPNLLSEWKFEPDAPNFTPRIFARCTITKSTQPTFEFDVRRRGPTGGLVIEHAMPVELDPGIGLFTCTYEGGGNPLPPFKGSPRLITVKDNPIDALLENSASMKFVVGIAVKTIPIDGSPSTINIWNKHTRRTVS